MILTRTDFEDETAWEGTVLALAVPLTTLSSSPDATLDLRTRNITVSVSSAMGENRAEHLRNSLLPLLFGAAWKILDLAVELALANSGRNPARSGRWTIEEKTREILQYGNLPGFTASSDLWRGIRTIYVSTKEARHALVHRHVKVDSSTQELIPFDPNGQSLLPLSKEEQMAFCRLAQRLTEAIRAGSLPLRMESDLLGYLSILQRHHGVTISAPIGNRPPARLIDQFRANGQIDVPSVMAEAQRTFPGIQYVDLEVRLADGRTLLGELEQAPNEVVTVDLTALPSWLRFL